MLAFDRDHRRGARPACWTVVLSLCWCACASKPPPPPEAPPPVEKPPPGPPPDLPALRASPGVVLQQRACRASGEEQCNAIDDDCDGAIDRGCGYESGEVQITISWNTVADIDLYVRDPSGETIFYNHKTSESGGKLDYDSRGSCRVEQELRNVENAYWPEPAPTGSYAVELHYFGPCGDPVHTTVTMSVAVRGHTLGRYSYELSPEERITALEFDLN